MEVYVQMKLLRPKVMSVFTVNYSKTSPAVFSTLSCVCVIKIKMLTWNWFTGFSQHLDRTKTHERAVVRKRIRYTRAETGADLCGVADILQGRVTGHHGTQVRQSAHAIQPASRVVLLRALKKLNYYMHKTERLQFRFQTPAAIITRCPPPIQYNDT